MLSQCQHKEAGMLRDALESRVTGRALFLLQGTDNSGRTVLVSNDHV